MARRWPAYRHRRAAHRRPLAPRRARARRAAPALGYTLAQALGVTPARRARWAGRRPRPPGAASSSACSRRCAPATANPASSARSRRPGRTRVRSALLHVRQQTGSLLWIKELCVASHLLHDCLSKLEARRCALASGIQCMVLIALLVGAADRLFYVCNRADGLPPEVCR